jgi:hypothetical protein
MDIFAKDRNGLQSGKIAKRIKSITIFAKDKVYHLSEDEFGDGITLSTTDNMLIIRPDIHAIHIDQEKT